jgi:hypothetical protein
LQQRIIWVADMMIISRFPPPPCLGIFQVWCDCCRKWVPLRHDIYARMEEDGVHLYQEAGSD